MEMGNVKDFRNLREVEWGDTYSIKLDDEDGTFIGQALCLGLFADYEYVEISENLHNEIERLGHGWQMETTDHNGNTPKRSKVQKSINLAVEQTYSRFRHYTRRYFVKVPGRQYLLFKYKQTGSKMDYFAKIYDSSRVLNWVPSL